MYTANFHPRRPAPASATPAAPGNRYNHGLNGLQLGNTPQLGMTAGDFIHAGIDGVTYGWAIFAAAATLWFMTRGNDKAQARQEAIREAKAKLAEAKKLPRW